MFKLKLSEPNQLDYAFIDPVTNIVHLLVPLASGESIGLDNTCKTSMEMKHFFGKEPGQQAKSALNQLIAYKESLKSDIFVLKADKRPNAALLKQKQKRLTQIIGYINILQKIDPAHPSLAVLDGGLPGYPEAIRTLYERQGIANIGFMKLSPERPDHFSTAPGFIFSTRRNPDPFPFAAEGPISLGRTLREYFRNIVIGARIETPIKDRFIENVLADIRIRHRGEIPAEVNDAVFESIIASIKHVFQTQYNREVALDRLIGMEQSDAGRLTKDNLDAIASPDEPNCKEYIAAILIAAIADNYWATLEGIESPFNKIKSTRDAEKLSIMTQFLLGHINIFCHTNNLSQQNFGFILDANQRLQENIAQTVFNAMRDGQSPEDTLFEFINSNYHLFGMSRPLTPAEQNDIRSEFRENYNLIEGSDHFDEFMLFRPAPITGQNTCKAVALQSRINVSFADFIIAGRYTSRVTTPDENQFIRGQLEHFRALTNPILTHKNEHITGSFEFNEDEFCTLLNERSNINSLARLLVTPALDADGTATDSYLFEVLPVAIIAQIKEHQHYRQLRKAVLAKISSLSLPIGIQTKFIDKFTESSAAPELQLYKNYLFINQSIAEDLNNELVRRLGADTVAELPMNERVMLFLTSLDHGEILGVTKIIIDNHNQYIITAASNDVALRIYNFINGINVTSENTADALAGEQEDDDTYSDSDCTVDALDGEVEKDNATAVIATFLTYLLILTCLFACIANPLVLPAAISLSQIYLYAIPVILAFSFVVSGLLAYCLSLFDSAEPLDPPACGGSGDAPPQAQPDGAPAPRGRYTPMYNYNNDFNVDIPEIDEIYAEEPRNYRNYNYRT